MTGNGDAVVIADDAATKAMPRGAIDPAILNLGTLSIGDFGQAGPEDVPEEFVTACGGVHPDGSSAIIKTSTHSVGERGNDAAAL